jgi:Ion channel
VPLNFMRSAFAQIFTQRCFYLFSALLILLVAVPLLGQTVGGRIAANGINLLILLTAIAAVGRSRGAFLIGVLLAVPTVGFQLLGLSLSETRYLALAWMFGAGFYFVTIVYLLRYVFSPDVMSIDKLYGAASVYLMLGLLWFYFYLLANYFFPGSFSSGGGAAADLSAGHLIYFTFTVLTTTGFGDITPVLPLARSLVTLEQLCGTLFIAILIARLAGIYPAKAGE